MAFLALMMCLLSSTFVLATDYASDTDKTGKDNADKSKKGKTGKSKKGKGKTPNNASTASYIAEQEELCEDSASSMDLRQREALFQLYSCREYYTELVSRITYRPNIHDDLFSEAEQQVWDEAFEDLYAEHTQNLTDDLFSLNKSYDDVERSMTRIIEGFDNMICLRYDQLLAQ